MLSVLPNPICNMWRKVDIKFFSILFLLLVGVPLLTTSKYMCVCHFFITELIIPEYRKTSLDRKANGNAILFYYILFSSSFLISHKKRAIKMKTTSCGCGCDWDKRKLERWKRRPGIETGCKRRRSSQQGVIQLPPSLPVNMRWSTCVVAHVKNRWDLYKTRNIKMLNEYIEVQCTWHKWGAVVGIREIPKKTQ